MAAAMLWGNSGRCQVGKVWGCSQEVLSVVLEGLWTQEQSTWSIYSYTTVYLSLLSKVEADQS